MVVTAEARHGADVPVIQKEDVMVYQGRDRVKTADWVPLQGDHAELELFLLLDDTAGASLGSQLEDLRKFIVSQPATTKIGVGYMRDGTVNVAQNLADDTTRQPKLCGYRNCWCERQPVFFGLGPDQTLARSSCTPRDFDDFGWDRSLWAWRRL